MAKGGHLIHDERRSKVETAPLLVPRQLDIRPTMRCPAMCRNLAAGRTDRQRRHQIAECRNVRRVGVPAAPAGAEYSKPEGTGGRRQRYTS